MVGVVDLGAVGAAEIGRGLAVPVMHVAADAIASPVMAVAAVTLFDVHRVVADHPADGTHVVGTHEAQEFVAHVGLTTDHISGLMRCQPPGLFVMQ